jgi:hypothetical protein
MKKQLLSFLGTLGLLMVAASAFAQNIHVRANVPFSFSIDKGTLPAGQYEIRAIDAAGGHVLAINNGEAKMGRMFLTNPVSRAASLAYPENAKLVFKRYGDQYFLSQIWVPGSNTGRELPTSVREAELARGLTPAKVVVLAGLH